jgi:IS30 family transposase
MGTPKKKAYETGDYTMQKIAEAFGVHHSTVSRSLHKTSLKNACLQNLTPFPCGITAAPQ